MFMAIFKNPEVQSANDAFFLKPKTIDHFYTAKDSSQTLLTIGLGFLSHNLQKRAVSLLLNDPENPFLRTSRPRTTRAKMIPRAERQ